MALDQNLFTLNIEQSKIEPTAVDLVDPSGTVHYRKRRLPNEAGTYLFSLSDPLSDSLLATATAPSATSKEKVIELHNPTVVVSLSFKGTLTFKWSFVWEEHKFEWKRESCYMIRKPDPPVLVAITKEPPGKIKTSVVQILDYNLNRFDIEDRKGLEIVLLTSLLTFSDQSEQFPRRPSDASASIPPPSASSAAPITPPPMPPKPEGWKEDQVAILQAKEQREINEVVIGEAGEVEDYAKHCLSLLNDDTILFITLRSHKPEFVSKVVQVAEVTKRTRYKSGGWDEELHQYVSTEDDAAEVKGKGKGKGKGPPRVIDLNDRPTAPAASTASKSYKPPASLMIHLSKIAMPELEPKAKKARPPLSSGGHSKNSSESKGQKLGKKSTGKPPPGPSTQQSNVLGAPLRPFASPPPGPRPTSAPPPNFLPQPPNSHMPPSNSQYFRPPGPPQPPPYAGSVHSPPGPGPNGYRPFSVPGPTNAPLRPPGYMGQPPQQYAPQAPPSTTSSGSFLDKLMGR